MSTIIAPARYPERVEYSLSFEHADCPGAGYGFPCDEHGNLDMADIGQRPAAVENLLHAFTSDAVLYNGVETYRHSWREGPTVRCDCGGVVHCDSHWENGCDGCGREYNGSGQQLAPRSQWGSEWATQPEEDLGYY